MIDFREGGREGVEGVFRQILIIHGRSGVESDFARRLAAGLEGRGMGVELKKAPFFRGSPGKAMAKFGFRNPEKHVIITRLLREGVIPAASWARLEPEEEHHVYEGMGEMLRTGHHYLDLGSVELIPVVFERAQRRFIPGQVLRSTLSLSIPRRLPRRGVPVPTQSLAHEAIQQITAAIRGESEIRLRLYGDKRLPAPTVEEVARRGRNILLNPPRVIIEGGEKKYRTKNDVPHHREALKFAVRVMQE